MASFKTTRLVPFSARQMFDLVADVESYPEFLPLCEALRLRERTADPAGRPQLVADMTCGYKSIRETFTSRVTLDQAAGEIVVEYIDGPFRYMHNRWRFVDSNYSGARSCAVHFDIDYAFKSALLGALVGGLFDTAFRRFAAAFEARAREVYGSGIIAADSTSGTAAT